MFTFPAKISWKYVSRGQKHASRGRTEKKTLTPKKKNKSTGKPNTATSPCTRNLRIEISKPIAAFTN